MVMRHPSPRGTGDLWPLLLWNYIQNWFDWSNQSNSTSVLSVNHRGRLLRLFYRILSGFFRDSFRILSGFLPFYTTRCYEDFTGFLEDPFVAVLTLIHCGNRQDSLQILLHHRRILQWFNASNIHYLMQLDLIGSQPPPSRWGEVEGGGGKRRRG